MHILLAILTFSFLIAFHELGHMWVARRMGMRVERYSIGFGPVLFSWKRGETEYVLSALPFGGYVKIAGMGLDEDIDPDDQGSYANKPTWRRVLVLAAGPAANYVLAFVIGVGLLMSGVQSPNFQSTRLGDVEPDYPAAKAGLQAGDEVKTVGGIQVHDWQSMRDAITAASKKANGAPVPFEVDRGGHLQTIQVKPTDSGSDGFKIGVAPSVNHEPGLGFLAAVPQAGINVIDQTAFNGSMLWKVITGQAKGALSGPIGILSQTAEQAKKGLLDLLQLVWALSIALGFFNLLPIPALDGGRLLFRVYEGISRRQMNQRTEEVVHTAGMFLLLVVIVFVSYGDIMRKFHRG